MSITHFFCDLFSLKCFPFTQDILIAFIVSMFECRLIVIFTAFLKRKIRLCHKPIIEKIFFVTFPYIIIF